MILDSEMLHVNWPMACLEANIVWQVQRLPQLLTRSASEHQAHQLLRGGRRAQGGSGCEGMTLHVVTRQTMR